MTSDVSSPSSPPRLQIWFQFAGKIQIHLVHGNVHHRNGCMTNDYNNAKNKTLIILFLSVSKLFSEEKTEGAVPHPLENKDTA